MSEAAITPTMETALADIVVRKRVLVLSLRGTTVAGLLLRRLARRSSPPDERYLEATKAGIELDALLRARMAVPAGAP